MMKQKSIDMDLFGRGGHNRKLKCEFEESMDPSIQKESNLRQTTINEVVKNRYYGPRELRSLSYNLWQRSVF